MSPVYCVPCCAALLPAGGRSCAGCAVLSERLSVLPAQWLWHSAPRHSAPPHCCSSGDTIVIITTINSTTTTHHITSLPPMATRIVTHYSTHQVRKYDKTPLRMDCRKVGKRATLTRGVCPIYRMHLAYGNSRGETRGRSRHENTFKK